jgi:hypothetical protein
MGSAAEVLLEFPDTIISDGGVGYMARACGRAETDGLWHGWIEFLPVSGGEPVRSPRETTQPNRTDAAYWATGLTPVYLEGALRRALKPLVRTSAAPPGSPVFDGPAADVNDAPGARVESVLNPYSVYRKGEGLLRSELGALSDWHLVNIIRAYDLSEQSDAALQRLPAAGLIELIVTGVRANEQAGTR